MAVTTHQPQMVPQPPSHAHPHLSSSVNSGDGGGRSHGAGTGTGGNDGGNASTSSPRARGAASASPHTAPKRYRDRGVSNASTSSSHSNASAFSSASSSTMSASTHSPYARPHANSHLHLAGGSTSPSAVPMAYAAGSIEPPHMPSLSSYGGGNGGNSNTPAPAAPTRGAGANHHHHQQQQQQPAPERDASGHISVASWLANRRMASYEKLFGSCGLATLDDIVRCSREMEGDLLRQIRKPGYRLKLRVLINDLRAGQGTDWFGGLPPPSAPLIDSSSSASSTERRSSTVSSASSHSHSSHSSHRQRDGPSDSLSQQSHRSQHNGSHSHSIPAAAATATSSQQDSSASASVPSLSTVPPKPALQVRPSMPRMPPPPIPEDEESPVVPMPISIPSPPSTPPASIRKGGLSPAGSDDVTSSPRARGAALRTASFDGALSPNGSTASGHFFPSAQSQPRSSPRSLHGSSTLPRPRSSPRSSHGPSTLKFKRRPSRVMRPSQSPPVSSPQAASPSPRRHTGPVLSQPSPRHHTGPVLSQASPRHHTAGGPVPPPGAPPGHKASDPGVPMLSRTMLVSPKKQNQAPRSSPAQYRRPQAASPFGSHTMKPTSSKQQQQQHQPPPVFQQSATLQRSTTPAARAFPRAQSLGNGTYNHAHHQAPPQLSKNVSYPPIIGTGSQPQPQPNNHITQLRPVSLSTGDLALAGGGGGGSGSPTNGGMVAYAHQKRGSESSHSSSSASASLGSPRSMQRPTGGSFDAASLGGGGGVFFATKKAQPPAPLRHSASFGGVLPGGGVTMSMSAPQSPMNARAHDFREVSQSRSGGSQDFSGGSSNGGSRRASQPVVSIAFLKTGEAFRKYRHGRGKDRTIWCSDTRIFWGTSSQKVKGSLLIQDIEDIVDGCQGATIQDFAFTIYTKSRTLELQASSKYLKLQWIKGIIQLLRIVQQANRNAY